MSEVWKHRGEAGDLALLSRTASFVLATPTCPPPEMQPYAALRDEDRWSADWNAEAALAVGIRYGVQRLTRCGFSVVVNRR